MSGTATRKKRESSWSDFGTTTTKALLLGFVMLNSFVFTLVSKQQQFTLFFPLDVYAWSLGQTLYTLGFMHGLADVLTRQAWESFPRHNTWRQIDQNNNNNSCLEYVPPLNIPTLQVQDFLGKPQGAQKARSFLETTYGRHWRETPLRLQGLWTVQELLATQTNRTLTPQGLLQNTRHVQIPYFSDATVVGALQPDAHDSMANIVQSILEGKPHKIGSQLLIQKHPELLKEVAPLEFLQELFGNHFTPNHLFGTNQHRTGWRRWLPGTTTVPVFIANTSPVTTTTLNYQNDNDGNNTNKKDGNKNSNSHDQPTCHRDDDTSESSSKSKPFTGLHCEPIANVAVQLWGSRTWTLVDPSHSFRLRPSIAQDGRSFFATQITTAELSQIPRYEITTKPGDAVWLPTWTYHQVDYVYYQTNNSDNTDELLHQHQLSIGASLFHFRPMDYFRKNPLFAFLLIPSLAKELAGIKTQ